MFPADKVYQTAGGDSGEKSELFMFYTEWKCIKIKLRNQPLTEQH